MADVTVHGAPVGAAAGWREGNCGLPGPRLQQDYVKQLGLSNFAYADSKCDPGYGVMGAVTSIPVSSL